MAALQDTSKPRTHALPENNPEVMNSLGHRLGLRKTLAFHDVYSLTEPDLLAVVPRPCYALLFIIPTTESSEKAWHEEEVIRTPYEGSGANEPIVWYHQTIGNACGLIGLLHCMSNLAQIDGVTPNSDLDQLIAQALPLKPTERAQLIYDSALLEQAHDDAAHLGESIVPPAEDEPPSSYVAYARGKDGHLWELEGRRKGPTDLGAMTDDEDLLSPSVVERGPGRFMKREQSNKGDWRFSVLALGPATE